MPLVDPVTTAALPSSILDVKGNGSGLFNTGTFIPDLLQEDR